MHFELCHSCSKRATAQPPRPTSECALAYIWQHTHTAAVGAGIGRKASQPLHTAMDRNSLLHCLLLVCSLHRVTMFPKFCLPATR